jgi:transketolase
MKPELTKLDERSKQLRNMIIRTMEHGKRGHPASAFSIVEILRVLYDDILKYDANNPQWQKRDRLILSKGHGCLALYVLLAEKKFFPEKNLLEFCKIDGLLGGHPEITIPGVEASTGSLGHGLPIGIGIAINAKYEKMDYRVFVLIGDGECNEGSIWEAALCAGKHKLNNLIVLIDYNKQMTYGSTYEVEDLEPFKDKWESFGFEVREVNGHNIADIKSVLSAIPFSNNKPNAIICHTVKGKGVREMENNPAWHHKSKLGKEDIEVLYKSLEEY